MKRLIDLLSCKNGDELFEKVTEILKRFEISLYNDDGSYKDTYTLLCEISEKINQGK